MKSIKRHTCYFTLSAVCGLVILASCGKEQDIVSSDVIILAPFDTILLQGVFDVELIQGDTFSLRFEGTEKAIEHITHTVQDEVLTMDNKNTALWTTPQTDPPVLFITSPQFKHIEVAETSSILSRDTLTSDKFGIVMKSKLGFVDLMLNCNLVYFWNGSPSGGDVILSGRTKFIHLYNSNLMAIDARQMPCEYAIVENASKGDIHLVVQTQLNYSITGTGNIYLYGDPAAIYPGELTSTGRLIR